MELYETGMRHRIEAERLLTIQTFEEQQRYMLENKIHRVDDRISFDAYNEGDQDEFEAVVEKSWRS